MSQNQAEVQEPAVDVVGRRLTVAGAIGAVVAGVLWFAQKANHDDGQAILEAVREPEAFNSTPYVIALSVALAVLVAGLVLSNTRR